MVVNLPIKKVLFPAMAAALAVTVLIGTLEIGARIMASPEMKREGAARLWENTANHYTKEVSRRDSGCVFGLTLSAHPWLGYLLDSASPCSQGHINDLGTLGRWALGSNLSKSYFTVAVLGGSVAGQLAMGHLHTGLSWIEEELNQNFESPNGKPFRVVAGALGGWNYPAQINFLALHGPSLDAVVAVDGNNEANRITAEFPLYAPDLNTYFMTTRPRHSWLVAEIMAGLARARVWITTSSWRKNSVFFYSAFHAALGWFDRSSLFREAMAPLMQHFDLPANWSKDRKRDWNYARYEQYLYNLKGISDAHGIRHAHFLQPVPFIGKEMTSEERKAVPNVDKEVILGLEQARARAEKRGVNTSSLLEVFSGIREQVYSDQVHCIFSEDGDSPGYRHMSRKIVKELARMWRLKRRSSRESGRIEDRTIAVKWGGER